MQFLLEGSGRGQELSGRGLEINQRSEVQEMEYRFIVHSDPPSSAPSEYHSDTEEREMEMQKGKG